MLYLIFIVQSILITKLYELYLIDHTHASYFICDIMFGVLTLVKRCDIEI